MVFFFVLIYISQLIKSTYTLGAYIIYRYPKYVQSPRVRTSSVFLFLFANYSARLQSTGAPSLDPCSVGNSQLTST
uniref:Putative secreted protein n=1 Tax=Anopheles darlingi TaxID=43151 RepID=A0A2M4D9S5_ANODA